MAIYNREDPRTALPQLEKQFNARYDGLLARFDGLLDFFYPVGCFFETSDTSFDPNVTWGGTWVLEVAGQVHVSSGTGYTVSGALTNTSDGGASTVTLTASQIPAHNHRLPADVFRYIDKTSLNAGGTGGVKSFSEDNGTYTNNNTGGGGAHNNMQPYIVVNRWHRTS